MGRIGVHPPDSMFQDSVSCCHYGHHPTHIKELIAGRAGFEPASIRVRFVVASPFAPPPGIYCALVAVIVSFSFTCVFTRPTYQAPPHTIEYFKELKAVSSPGS